MSNRHVGLTSLSDYVSQFLSSTENVKRVLEAECEEARFVLRPWPIETIITKEIDESCCTCDSKPSLEDHVDEIVEGIGRALAQAQQLREKIAINVSNQKRKMRAPSLQSIYSSTSTASGSKLSAKKGQSSKYQKASTTTSGTAVNTGTSKGEQKEKKIQSVRAKNTESIVDKKLIRTSAGNTMASSKNSAKPAKNFVAANKSNIKNCKRFSRSTVDLTARVKKSSDSLATLSGTSQSLSGCSTSFAELNSLMDRVSVGARTSGSSSSCLQSEEQSCPCHGENAQQFVQERIRTTVDMIEGLDRFGVSGDVVRILKMYNSYLNKASADKVKDKRTQRAANGFLLQFGMMNEDRDCRRKAQHLARLTTGFASLLRDCHSLPPGSTSETSSINLRYAELDSQSKDCQLKKFDPVEFRKPKASSSKNERRIARGWSSNGVWNPAVIHDGFPGITRAHCIRYANKGQLLSFFEHSQRLQQLLYHRNLMELLLTKVIPDVERSFDPDSEEYCEAYKTIFTAAQVLNPRLAVLVQTDV